MQLPYKNVFITAPSWHQCRRNVEEILTSLSSAFLTLEMILAWESLKLERKLEGKISFLVLFYLPCFQLGATEIWTNFKANFLIVHHFEQISFSGLQVRFELDHRVQQN